MIREVIANYVEIQGDKCICPFHKEKSPSLNIYEDTNSFYCFGCGEGGDDITFVMEHEGLDFNSALAKICSILNITKEQYMEQKNKEPDDKVIETIEPMDINDVKQFIKSTGYCSNGYRGIRDEVNQFYGHLTKLDTEGNVLARYYPETNNDGKVTGYKCRNHPKDFSYGKIGHTGTKSQLSGQVKFKSPAKYCVPMDTKTLCKEKGWVDYNQLEVGDSILAYDSEDGTKKWTKVKEKHFFKDQEIQTIGNSGFTLRATDNHRWYVMQRSTESDNKIKTFLPEVRKTSELTSESRLIVNAPFNKEEDASSSFEYEISKSKRNVDWVTRVLSMTHIQRISFLDGFMIADGHFKEGVNSVWTWGQNDGNLFEAAITASYLVHDGIIRVKNRPINGSGNLFKDVTLSSTKHVARLTQNKGEVTKGDVWCVTTDLNTWVIRQGDTISITGNCLYVGGEEDKTAAYQMLKDNRKDQEFDSIPVVSPTSGEGSAAKQAAAQYDWFDMYDIIVIGMDNDDAGRKAAKEIAAVLPKEKLRIATWSGKDPNQMLIDGKEKQFVRDFYNAKEYVSSGIKTSANLMNDVTEELLRPRISLPPHMHKLEKNTGGGFLQGRIINIIGDTSVGKSVHVNGMVYHWIFNAPERPGIVSLEATAGQYALDMLALHMEKNFIWGRTGEEVLDYLNNPEVKALYDDLWVNEFGEPRFAILDERDGDIKQVEKKIEQLIHQHNCKIIVIDVLSDILRSLPMNEQEEHMAWQKRIVKTGITIVNVLHTRKPGPSSDGTIRKVTEYDALGTGTFVQSGAINIVINRDKMSEDNLIKNCTEVEMPKCRGGVTGPVGFWYYDFHTRKVWDLDDWYARDIPENQYEEAEEIDF